VALGFASVLLNSVRIPGTSIRPVFSIEASGIEYPENGTLSPWLKVPFNEMQFSGNCVRSG
jgi:hypothetical protein